MERHLNHPWTSCQPAFDELIKMSEILADQDESQLSQQGGRDSLMEDCTGSMLDCAVGGEGEISSMEDEDLGEMLVIDSQGLGPSEGHVPCKAHDTRFFTESHPDPSKIYGRGRTFMDFFDADEFASQRSENLYYPFASKQDWETASWLLRSSLSMAEIDAFLRLELVRTFFSITSIDNYT